MLRTVSLFRLVRENGGKACLSGLLLLGLLGVLPGCGERKAVLTSEIQHRGKLVAGVKFDSKPFGFLDSEDGQLKGYDIDLMREISRRLLNKENAVEFQQVFSSTRVIAIDSGSVDVVAATMTITPKRAKVVAFSDPYLIAHQAVVVPTKSSVKSLSDLNGKTILFVLGTTSEATIKKRLPQAKYTGFKSSTDAFSALKSGRGDAMTTDDTIISGFLTDNCGFRVLNEKLSDEPYGLAFRKGSAQAPDELRLQVNKYLAEMKQDGTLERLKAKWVDTALNAKPCKP
ncbi:MAG: amino acid transporter substrate-binding protein [Vampirovibrio sp.]|jgi:putative glutamine transport system substrate-binding protein|nr:amino acid transporter substrate-binding protein [Vampirovibrio sp.]